MLMVMNEYRPEQPARDTGLFVDISLQRGTQKQYIVNAGWRDEALVSYGTYIPSYYHDRSKDDYNHSDLLQ